MIRTILFVIFFSASVFAAGGQSGSGGNGCWVTENRTIVWRSIEELTFSQLIMRPGKTLAKITFPHSSSTSPASFDLWRNHISVNAFSKLQKLQMSAPNTFEVLNELSRLFKVSYVINTTLDGHFDADLFAIYPKCHSFSPALMTLNDGTIIFFRPAWDKMDSFSGEIMLIHETIRLAQKFHPAFASIRDKDLQYITALLFSDQNSAFRLKQVLGETEKRLKTFCTSYEYYGNGSFRDTFLENLCAGRDLSRRLNAFRSENENVRESLENIKKLVRK